MAYRNEGDGEGTGRGSSPSGGDQSSKHPHAPKGSARGGQFVKKESSSGGSSSGRPGGPARTVSKDRPPVKKAAASPSASRRGASSATHSKAAHRTAKTHRRPLRSGDSGSAVAELHQALAKLDLRDSHGRRLAGESYGPGTVDAVMQAQRRLGLRPTGRASATLVRRLHDAAALSPCVKRSTSESGPSVTRAYTTPREATVQPLTVPDTSSHAIQIADASWLQGMGAPVADIMRYQRWWPLEDIEISRAHTDGRTVVAYASVFDQPYPVSDQYGDYEELVERSAFNKWLADGNISRAMCLYNHGYTIHGTPSDVYAVPLGQPLEIVPDGRGLKTITRYNEGPDVDRVLEAIRNGAIRGQSFRGRIVRSTPNARRFGVARDGKRTMVTRHELGLTDYGPTPMPVNASAEILAVRSMIASELGVSTEQLAELIRHLASTTPVDQVDAEPETATSTSSEEAGAEEPPATRSEATHSGRQPTPSRRARVAMILRGMTQ